MWQSYIQPAFLYGMEIMDYNKSGIKELETIQRNLMKIVLRVIQCEMVADWTDKQKEREAKS